MDAADSVTQFLCRSSVSFFVLGGISEVFGSVSKFPGYKLMMAVILVFLDDRNSFPDSKLLILFECLGLSDIDYMCNFLF